MAEKEVFVDKVNIKGKNLGAAYKDGVYNGELRKGTFGMQPHGNGTAEFSSLRGTITQTGFWKKGEFVEGKMTTPDYEMNGVYENNYLRRGRVDLPNGDYYDGAFGTVVQLNSFHQTNKDGTVFEGKVIYLGDKSCILGSVTEPNGSVREGLFVCDRKVTNYEKGALVRSLTQHNPSLEFVFGTAKFILETGEKFEGFRVNIINPQFVRENISTQSLGRVVVKANLSMDLPEEYKNVPEIDEYISKLRGRMPTEILANFEEDQNKVFTGSNLNYYGTLNYSATASEPLEYSIRGAFSFDTEPNKYSKKLYYTFIAPEITLHTPKCDFVGDNMPKGASSSTEQSNLEFVKGVYTDKANNSVFKGIFSFDQNEADKRTAFKTHLRFRSGEVRVTLPNRNNLYSVSKTSATVAPDEDLKGVRAVGDSRSTKNGDFQKGTFNIDFVRGEPLAVKFISGREKRTVDTTALDGKCVVYEIENYNLVSRDDQKFTFKECKDLKIEPTYFGKITETTQKGSKLGEIMLKGAFTGDFIKMNFELIEGDIRQTTRQKTDGADISRILNLQKYYIDSKIPIHRGSERVFNAIVDGDRIDSITKVGDFIFDADTYEVSLINGDLEMSAPDRNYELTTSNGTNFAGKILVNSDGATLARKGAFVYDEGRDDYIMQSGKVMFKKGDYTYKAEFDGAGLEHFSGKRFAGTLYNERTEKGEIVIINSLKPIYNEIKRRERIEAKKETFSTQER